MVEIKVELQDTMSNDRGIAESAWTSSLTYSGKELKTDGDVKRIVNMLADHKHSTPFESVIFRFWMRIPIQTDRQHMTHRIACLSLDNELYFDLPSTGKGIYKSYKKTLGEFVSQWEGGVKSKTKWGGTCVKDHKKRLKTMKLRSINEETGEIQHTSVQDIHNNGTQPVFEVELESGYKIKSTLNHRYLTDKGWMTLAEATGLREDLKETPNVFLNDTKFSVNGEKAYKNYEHLKELREKGMTVTEMAEDVGASYHTIRKWLKKHNLQFKPSETRFKKDNKPWNIGKSYTHKKPYNISDEERQQKSVRASGSNSNFWKGGVSSESSKLRSASLKLKPEVLKRDDYKCTNCNSEKTLQSHHIIPMYADLSKALDLDNLTTLCKPCHRYIHNNNLEEEFASKRSVPFKAKKSKARGHKLVRTFKSIKTITYVGEEPTYDLEVKGPYHNFVCNGVVVHNSHNGMSGRYRTMPDDFLSLSDEVVSIMEKGLGGAQALFFEHEYKRWCTKTNSLYREVLKDMKQAEKDGKVTNEEYKRVREVYRGILPQNNMTERVTTMNLRSFANYVKLRNSPHAQPEIRKVAELMLQAVKDSGVCPIALEALERNGWQI